MVRAEEEEKKEWEEEGKERGDRSYLVGVTELNRCADPVSLRLRWRLSQVPQVHTHTGR